jgi:hypothetical protein
MRFICVLGILLLTMVSSAAVELLPGGFFAPGSDAAPDIEPGQTRLRWGQQYMLYVTEPGEVTVTVSCAQVGQFEDNAKLRVVGPDGEELATTEAAMGETATASFSAAQVGPHTLDVNAGRNAFTLAAEGAKLLMPAGADGQPFSGVTRAAPTFLFVPTGAKQFTVQLTGQGTGETAQARLLRPDGSEAAALSTVGKMSDTVTVDVPVGADDAVWALVIAKADSGVFEDFSFVLSGDVSPWVAEKPGDLLSPVLSVSSGRVSRAERDPVPTVDLTLYTDLAALDNARVELQATPVDAEDAAWSRTITESPERSISAGPGERLPDGKYAWSARLMQGDTEVASFGGHWWFVPAPEYITEDGTTLVNGEPFFVRGLYHVEPEDYELVASHGFNAVQTRYDNVPAAQAAGLKTGVALYWTASPYTERWREAMQSVIDNDSVFAWWIQDEPDGRRADLETMADAYLYVRTQDPLRPAYTCLCVPGSYELYAPQTDIVSIDVYPIGRSPIVRISETLEHAQDVIPNHVHYFIGQIWPWSGGPLVTPEQHRCMTYLALAHGARGLLWYSFRDPNWYIPDNNPELWAEMKLVNDELIELEPALLTPNLGEAVFGEGESAVHASARRAGDELFVIATNPGDEAVSAQINLAQIAPGVQCRAAAEVMFGDHQVRVMEGAIVDEFEPLAARVYRLEIED